MTQNMFMGITHEKLDYSMVQRMISAVGDIGSKLFYLRPVITVFDIGPT